MPHAPRLHAPHPHVPHLHVHPGFDEHPWRLLPTMLIAIGLFATALIAISFAVAKAFTGHAY